ncbi:uncharacterized protein RCC_01158 [Ramularia collo-cygni]|uniref:Uncharacterized protein n=1 Tax=Ramularia collo-cygni TaxID=112498 RepID=A0A2D3UYQ2_9PEZI|nr:uncharacterized protein RCC_01158 [Ramularia collo-cygni]CZT15294.1 uncharacterized protein RCC_01158 [Ramularia collo-cygni]
MENTTKKPPDDDETSRPTSENEDQLLCQLKTDLNTLPQELYNQIHDEVFTATSGARRIVPGGSFAIKQNNPGSTLTRAHHHFIRSSTANTHLLQVSSGTRAKYAETYFGNGAVFEFHTRGGSEGAALFRRWLASIQDSHRSLINEVKICVLPPVSYDQYKRGRWGNYFLRLLRRGIEDAFGRTFRAEVAFGRGGDYIIYRRLRN